MCVQVAVTALPEPARRVNVAACGSKAASRVGLEIEPGPCFPAPRE